MIRDAASSGFILTLAVKSRAMSIHVKPAEELAAHWAEGNTRAVRDALENPASQAQYDWGLGFATQNLRKLTRKANQQAIMTFSSALLKQLALEGAERVMLIPLPEGGALLRRATEDDVI